MKNNVFQEYFSYLQSVRGLSDRTLVSYKTDLSYFRLYCESKNIEVETSSAKDLQGFIVFLGTKKLSTVSLNRALSSIRGFYKWLLRFGYRSDDPSVTLRNRTSHKNLPSFLWEREMAFFAELPEKTKILWKLRDKALILIMYSAGLRISEVVSLSINDIDFEGEEDIKSAKVTGKGNKERYVFFSSEAFKALKDYLPERSGRINAEKNTDKLFISRRGKALSANGVRWIIEKYSKASALEKNIHPHSLRHSFATHLVNSGCDVRIVQELLGHARISTTQRYAHVDMERLKQVYAKAHPHGTFEKKLEKTK